MARERIIISQGEVYGSDLPCTISTILGSCVSVCLYDISRSVGGMNHFVVPRSRTGGRPDARYGEAAIDALIAEMTRLGCSLKDLRAKVFGGAVPPWISPGSRFAVGAANVLVAREILAQRNIPIIAERTGGGNGMKIFFDTMTGDVALRQIERYCA